MAKKLPPEEKLDAEARKKAEAVAFFLKEIDAARKREKDYRKEGRHILELYAAEKESPFAILYSNTETLLPALYSAVPRPVVQRRFKDEDPLGKFAATAGNRVLEFLVDTNVEGYETFDEAIRSAVLTALLPGRGVTAIRYDHDTQDVTPAGAAEGTQPIPVKNWESVCCDSQPWDRFLHGYAKKWSKVPWISYELHLDRDDALKAGIAEEYLAKIQFTKGEDDEKSEDDSGVKADVDEEHIGERKTALFYQIWDKDDGRKVRYLAPQYKEDFCAVLDDPLGLTGFFNCPRPIQFVERVHDLLPVPLYALYEDQAEEVNNLTRRIKGLIKAIKARGVYDTELGEDIKKILDAEEGDLLPADKSSSLAAEKGLQNAIWMWPVQDLIVVLTQLYAAREQAKRVIYEITGISDIIRGSTVASETATAQEIKSEFGKLRLKRPQKEVQRYARDLLRMMLDVAAQKFSERTWAQMTGLPFITTEEFIASQNIVAKAQKMGMQPDAQTQAKLQMPVWGKVLEVLKSDMQRAYRIDIESNSTVEPEAVEDQKMIAEVMNALAQYLNGVAPLVQSGALPFQAAQAMMLAIVRRFRFGTEIEDYIKTMQPPKPPDDGKAGAQAAAEQKAASAEMRAQQVENQAALEKQGVQQLERKAQLDQREQSMKAEEVNRALREELATVRLDDKMARIQAARDKAVSDLEIKSLKIAQQSTAKSATEATSSAAKQSQITSATVKGLQDVTANIVKAQTQALEQQQTTAEMFKGFQEVLAQLNSTLSVLANASKAPRELEVRRVDGKVTGGTSTIITH